MARARLRTEPAPAKAGDVLRREKRLPAARTRRPAGTCASDSSCAPWMDEEPKKEEIGRAHVRTPVTNAHLVCRLLLEKKTKKLPPTYIISNTTLLYRLLYELTTAKSYN